jgi:sentrin-specific protease 8
MSRYLEREELRKFPSSHIVLLRPSMAFMLMKTPSVLSLRDALPDFSKTTHIFLPINDARNVSIAEGGSHWSLLLVSVIDGVAFHYDSLSPSNYNEAMLATQKISELLGRGLRFMNLEDSPQQENGSDCGVYVCIQMRHLLLKRLLSANAREKVSMSMGGKLVDAFGGRKEMLKTIERFRKEGERRRSWVPCFICYLFLVYVLDIFLLTFFVGTGMRRVAVRARLRRGRVGSRGVRRGSIRDCVYGKYWGSLA